MATSGVYTVMGEANCVVALLNKARRQYQLSHQAPSLEDTDPLLRNFTDLKEVLNEVADLSDMNPLTYLSPFLDVIKAQNTNGPITEAALAAVAKFLNYGLIDASSIKAANAVESIAYAVVHTKFIGGKSTGSDECVLFKILQVLRSLLLSPPGILLSNEAVCDMMQSCFRIVFEQNLSLLLRKAAESTLSDMTQLIFTRLPTFVEDTRHPYIRQLVNTNEKRQKRKKKRISVHVDQPPKLEEPKEDDSNEKTKLIVTEPDVTKLGFDVVLTTDPVVDAVTHPDLTVPPISEKHDVSEGDEADTEGEGDEGTRTISRTHAGLQRDIESDEEDPTNHATMTSEEQMPYGLPCCRELLRFLITMINPLDRNNTESMVVLGLNLLVVSLEAVADHLPNYDLLMPLIKDNLCRSLLQLLDTEKLPVLAATNRCCFLLFESMRMNLKFQLEAYLKKLQSIVLSEKNPISNGSEQKEMALESLVHLWRIPGLVTEMYLNYDCDLYCSNIFEDLTKLLVENSFPTMGGHTASLLSLDALLVVIDTIEQNCEDRANSKDEKPQKNAVHLRENRHPPSPNLPSMPDVLDKKQRKRLIAEGTELFNQNSKKGIEFLQEKGILQHDVESVVHWLRTNPHLDKKSIADYICNRKHENVLAAFVKSFPFEGTRLDVALRMFLETFRLPGEAAEIAMVMQHFSDEWYRANHEPFNDADAPFTLSYAIIMLNMDQHNPQVKRAQPPMTVDCFKRNVSGTNGGQDFDQDMLVEIYNSIKSEEIVMPAEQKGIVKENYDWKVLLRRGETEEGVFYHAPNGWNDHDLFAVCWGPAVAALSYVFDKSELEQILQKALTGYRKCAKIAAHYGMKEVFDNLCIHLCKFTTLTSMHEGGAEENLELQRQRSLQDSNSGHNGNTSSPEAVSLAFGENHKAQLATKTLFYLVHENGNILREGWRNVFEVLLQLFRARLLPADMIEVDDYVDEKGWVSIQRIHQKELSTTRSETGLLSWFGLGGGASEAERRKPTQEQLTAMQLASSIIAECKPHQIIADSKYLTTTALSELINAIAANSVEIMNQAEAQRKNSLSGEDEDALVFYHEIMVSIALENKDRLPDLWPRVKQHLEWLFSPKFGKCPVLVERAVVGLLRIANRNLFRDNTVSDEVLNSLTMLLKLSPKALFIFSRQIAYGLYELIRTNAANIHKKEHWAVLFELLETSGAAVFPDDYVPSATHKMSVDRNAYSDVEQSSRCAVEDRAYTSEGEERKRNIYDSTSDLGSRVDSSFSLARNPTGQADWIHLDHKDAAKATEEALRALGATRTQGFDRGSLVLRTGLGRHEPAAFLRVCECLAFLLRDAIHVTPDNFESSLQCLRTMVEASLDGGCYAAGPFSGDAQNRLRSTTTEERIKRHHHHHHGKVGKKELSTDVSVDAEESKNEEQQLSANYQQMSLHLLDLCLQLHSKAPEIFEKWSNPEGAQSREFVAFVWAQIWKPLLQAMARLSCDCRRNVRAAALTHLQKAIPSMPKLGATEWESCFGEVLFPLLTKLLEPFSQMDPIGMEDTRVRTIQLVARTLLSQLKELVTLHSFSTLWLKLVDFMEKYLKVDSNENLKEAIPESLKNMLLVMDNNKLFETIPGLYDMTVERLRDVFPQIIKDTIPNPPQAPAKIAEISSSHDSVLKQFGKIQISAPVPSDDVTSSTTQTATSEPETLIGSASTPLSQEHAGQPLPEVRPPPVPLTEVVVKSDPTSPVGSPPVVSPTETSPQHLAYQQHYAQQQAYQEYYQHYQQQQQQYQPQQQQEQYAYSPEAAAYYQQQYEHQQQLYQQQQQQNYAAAPEIYGGPQPQQQFAQYAQPSSSTPTVHGQYFRSNPLPIPNQPFPTGPIVQPQVQHPIVAPSANSAFSQVYTNQTSSAPQESPYFTPIPYHPPQNQQ
ncbi:unnamed protein product [Caenorhabditis bovis]|uniref:SEC7 domain-containing protein n=1 Tax=Caenorhabditis bovis TaxID=2654633 RepID=A0A8S1ETN1_9PELO|nr:unnamed protein product [Caenorhabditis bovis]